MLVIEDKRKLVINTKRRDEVAKVIPHAKLFEHNGQKLVALEHGLDEVQVLRNMGYKKAPSPILHYYNWPGHDISPMIHQKETAAFFTLNKRALCLNAPGTGKTLSTLWAADYLLAEGIVKKVLIVAPLSTLKTVWGVELKRHFLHRNFAILVGKKEKRLEMAAHPDLNFAIINHDGYTLIADQLTDFDLIVYDEATALKSPTSMRFKKFFGLMKQNNPWLWMLTGTPVSQNPTDAWTLAKLVNSPNVPQSYTRFKELVMQKVTMFKWIPRSEALDICKQVLQPSIRFALDECKDLPETVFLDHTCDLTATQKFVFNEMYNNAISVAHNISAPNAAVVMAKLIQICCGAAYDADGEVVKFDFSDRYDLLKEVLDEIGDKVIVYVPLRGVQQVLFEKLRQNGYDVEIVNGDVSKDKRNDIFHRFQNTDEIKVLLAHPKVASHGLTLTRAKDIIWYAPIYSLEQYEQANARIRRLTTTGKTRVHHISATVFERELYKRLIQRKRVLNDFLELVKGVNE